MPSHASPPLCPRRTGSAQSSVLASPSSLARADRPPVATQFVNPGGPGGAGASWNYRFGPSLSAITSGHYDIIGFDPRGIGASTPRIDCFNSTLEWELFRAGTVLEHGFDIPHDPFSHDALLSLTNQQRELSALLEAQYKVCRENVDLEDLKQSGTSTVVRDIEEISRQLDGAEVKINFAGFSSVALPPCVPV